MAFGGCVILWSLWLVYQWAIKPEREARRQQAEKEIEDLHREHWRQLKRDFQTKSRDEKTKGSEHQAKH